MSKYTVLGESTLLISRVSLVLLFYLLVDSFLPNSRVNVVLSSVLFAGVVNQSNMFQNLKKYVNSAVHKGQFQVEMDATRGELIGTLFDLNEYTRNGAKWNNKHRLLFKQMSNQQQTLVNNINYAEKLNRVDQLMKQNAKVLSQISSLAQSKYQITNSELKMMREAAFNSKRNNYYRVVESLCHFARDWSPAHYAEIDPLIEYIRDQTKDLNPSNTTVVVPGSGLGRVAYEVSQMNFSSVHAVEYSWLMVLMNEYMFHGGKDLIYPYLHTYSNHLATADQFRSVEINKVESQPKSLFIHNGDFTKFDLERHLGETKSDNIVIVTCFFIDTAENMMDYIESINKLCSKFKGTKRWINLGPLKYGTAAQVELSDEEIKSLIKLMGWKITDEQKPELLGYLTDTKGLWQGYYNVLKWTSELK